MEHCTQCGAVFPDMTQTCERCGFSFQEKAERLQNAHEPESTRTGVQKAVQSQKNQRSFLIGLLALLGLRYNPQTGSWKIAFVPATLTTGTLVTVLVASVVLTHQPPPPGRITEFAMPTSNSFPRGITAGPDGNLWFTEVARNKIGRITPSGGITEFAIPTSNSTPGGITTGPDGNLWFTEGGTQGGANKIGRITCKFAN